MALVKSIIFVDGENLSIRYQAMLESGRAPLEDVIHVADTLIWRTLFGQHGIPQVVTDVLRIAYYTSVVGDDNRLTNVKDRIAALEYSNPGDYYRKCQVMPRVFKKEARGRKSRLVDISITIDVMRHAYRGDVDVVYLFSGDGDFVDLVSEVARSGRKVCVGALSSGLDPRLRHAVDSFIDLDDLFFQPDRRAIAEMVGGAQQ